MVSMFRDRLYTNYVPTGSETVAISADVASYLLELKDIEQRIDALSARRAELQQYVDAHKALISIPRRLPRDIISEIFVACLPAHQNAVIDATEAPLVLSHICSAWREIALTTPRLWASLHVPLQFIAADVDRTPILEEWLKRSGACPLSLSIYGDQAGSAWADAYPAVTPEYLDSALDVLLRHSEHWRLIRLSGLSHHMSTKLLQQPPQKVPVLEYIEFCDFWQELSTFEIGLADRLRCLVLPFRPGIEWIFSQSPPAVHWERLTHLGFWDTSGRANMNSFNGTVSRFSLPTACRILARCSQLEHFQFMLSPGNFESEDPLMGLSHERTSNSLRTLIILQFVDRPHCPDHVWDALPTMPHLESFRLYSATSSLTLGKIFSKMPCLQRLVLSANLHEGLDFFHFLPCITYLELNTTVSANVFDFLTPIPTSEWQTGVGSLGLNPCPCPCPALEELIIATLAYVPDGVVVDFSEQRETQVLSPEEMECFKASGWDITFTFRPPADKTWHPWPHGRPNGATGRPLISDSIFAR
ncbi:hypothetical protein C8F01DRAFT_1180431 [Mycena amicta]|nr:hypothetical protein C8F01DRAFT_1180431 [Mycena amicta]